VKVKTKGQLREEIEHLKSEVNNFPPYFINAINGDQLNDIILFCNLKNRE